MPSHHHRHLTGRPAAGALALLTLAACGRGATAETSSAAPTVVVTPSAPYPCAATSGLALPQGWPGQVPLPPGLVVTRTERRSGDRLIAHGRVPGDFHAVVTFFNSSLSAAGFTQTDGQVDPHDAESDFRGSTLSGRWTTGTSGDCAGNSDVTVLTVAGAGSSADTDTDTDTEESE